MNHLKTMAMLGFNCPIVERVNKMTLKEAWENHSPEHEKENVD